MPTAINKSNQIAGDYFQFPAVNASRIKAAGKSLKHYFGYTPKAATPAMREGTLLHCLALEPDEFFARYHVAGGKPNLRTKAGKAEAEAIKEEASGREIIWVEEMAEITNMVNAIGLHPAGKMLDGKGQNELPLTAMDPASGLQLKIKVDRLAEGASGALIPVDIKKARDASPRGFTKACTDYGYGIQAAFYEKVLRLVFPGREIKPMRFVLVEPGSNEVGVYTLDEFSLRALTVWIDKTLILISTSKPEEVPPAYFKPGAPLGMHEVSLPDWYLNKLTD